MAIRMSIDWPDCIVSGSHTVVLFFSRRPWPATRLPVAMLKLRLGILLASWTRSATEKMLSAPRHQPGSICVLSLFQKNKNYSFEFKKNIKIN
jgi:hypothetical protein